MKLNDTLYYILKMTKLDILKKNDICKRTNNYSLDIDLLFENNEIVILFINNYDNININKHISKYISDINYIKTNLNKQCYCFYITKTILNKDIQQKIDEMNIIKHIYSTNIDIIIDTISDILYENKIYFYDNDDTTIMLQKSV